MTQNNVRLNKADDTRTRLQTRSGRGPVKLPRELVTDAAGRLGWAGLIYAGAFAISYGGWRLSETTAFRQASAWPGATASALRKRTRSAVTS